MANKHKVELFSPDNNKSIEITKENDGTSKITKVQGSPSKHGHISEMTDKDGDKHPILGAPDGLIIETNPCRWILVGNRWYYVCN